MTLIELLVVILIIIIVSVVALPTVISAMSHRQVSEAARILQGGIVGARDSAIHSNAPAGIRLLPDPAFSGIGPATRNGRPNAYAGVLDTLEILAYNRFVPLEPAPAYASGKVSAYPVTAYTSLPFLASGEHVLVLEQSPSDGTLPNEPTSWGWNLRVGDRVTIGNSGKPYTVVGPMQVGPAGGNSELFINSPPPGGSGPYPTRGTGPSAATVTVDYLYLVNGLDDDGNGLVDDGHNGVPTGTWEIEAWDQYLAAGRANLPYSVARRPVPSSKGREVALPSNVVIDGTGWGLSSPERSRFGPALNGSTGCVDLMVNPDGTIVPTTLYSAPASFGLGAAFVHFWIAERGDLVAPSGIAAPYLPIGDITTEFGLNQVAYSGPRISGEFAILTLFARSGKTGSLGSATFDNPNRPIIQFYPNPPVPVVYDPTFPFLPARQGDQ
jgi:type II secretory pathway pseudopilin PulG